MRADAVLGAGVRPGPGHQVRITGRVHKLLSQHCHPALLGFHDDAFHPAAVHDRRREDNVKDSLDPFLFAQLIICEDRGRNVEGCLIAALRVFSIRSAEFPLRCHGVIAVADTGIEQFFRQAAGDPVAPAVIQRQVDAYMPQRSQAAQGTVLFQQDRFLSLAGSGDCRRNAGNPAADHNHIRFPVDGNPFCICHYIFFHEFLFLSPGRGSCSL